MERSRRDLLRGGGGLLAVAGLAGCIEQRVTRRETRVESSTTWALNPAVGASLNRDAFEQYTEEMADRYGESGVWGIESDHADGFETAYVQRLGIARRTPAEPGGSESSLDPGEVDPDAPLLFVDACVAIYSAEADRYRYWLWIAADAADGRLVRDVDVSTLRAQLRFRDGAVVDAAGITEANGVASVSLGPPPSSRFPLDETTRSVEAASSRGEGGHYTVAWSGDAGGVQSVNGACEEERAGDHDLFWGITAGYSYQEQI